MMNIIFEEDWVKAKLDQLYRSAPPPRVVRFSSFAFLLAFTASIKIKDETNSSKEPKADVHRYLSLVERKVE